MKSKALLIGAGLLGGGLLMAASSKTASAAPAKPGGGGGNGGGNGGASSWSFTPSSDPDSFTPAGYPSFGRGDGFYLLSTLPQTPQSQMSAEERQGREDQIVDWVRTGHANVSWAPMVFTKAGLTASIPVMTRTLRVGYTNPARVSVDYDTMQRIADMIGACMMTRLIANRTRRDSTIALEPITEGDWVGGKGVPTTMGDSDKMLAYTKIVDKLVPIDTGNAFVTNEGKLWVVTKQFWQGDPSSVYPPNKKAANYGWWTSLKPTPHGPYGFPGQGQPTDNAIWQNIGLAHDWSHVDYSQQIVLASKLVTLSGTMNGACHIASLLSSPDYFDLLSDEGILPAWKHPAYGNKEVSASWQALLDAGLPLAA